MRTVLRNFEVRIPGASWNLPRLAVAGFIVLGVGFLLQLAAQLVR